MFVAVGHCPMEHRTDTNYVAAHQRPSDGSMDYALLDLHNNNTQWKLAIAFHHFIDVLLVAPQTYRGHTTQPSKQLMLQEKGRCSSIAQQVLAVTAGGGA